LDFPNSKFGLQDILKGSRQRVLNKKVPRLEQELFRGLVVYLLESRKRSGTLFTMVLLLLLLLLLLFIIIIY
jgi:hypothetical protein